ncbi:MAG: calcium/sodium antiporter [Acidimicrobiia bacterium]|jgi:cation:H+ antiporter
MTVDVLLIAVGVVGLVFGADWLVRGASSLAERLGVSPLVIGLTVVAFGTSAPELAVSVGAAIGGSTDVALGNVVGSNIFNVLVILGAAAVVRAQVVQRRLVRIEVPFLIAVSAGALLVATDGEVGRAEGVTMIAVGVGYTVWLIVAARRSREPEPEVPGSGHHRTPAALGLVAVGLVALVAGAQALVSGATGIAGDLGVSELVVGLTVVAAGTSLPELATSLIAARRGQADIAVGNVIGSNLFNLLIVLGTTATILPVPASIAARTVDLPVMTVVAVACLPVFFTGHRVSRWEGWVFLAGYLGYATYLVLRGIGSPVASDLGTALAVFTLPPLLLTLAVLAVRQLHAERRRASRPT